MSNEASARRLSPAANEAASEPILSVVSPVYLAEDCIRLLVSEIQDQARRISEDFEIILVDDGSPDASWLRIQEACASDGRVKGIRLSRNFGQHYAITAGLAAARGKFVIVMDCDLQDDPSYISELYAEANRGFDVVYTRKESRSHQSSRNIGGRLFHWAVNTLAVGTQKTVAEIGNYSILSRRVVNAFLDLQDTHRHYLGLLRWLGYPSSEIAIEHRARSIGRSSYTFRRLLREAVTGITSQTDRLLYLALAVGGIFVLMSFGSAVYLVIAYYVKGFREGWTSLIVLHLLSAGTTLLALGVVGIYVGKIFEQTKRRPLYLIDQQVNMETDGPRPSRRTDSGES